MVHQELSGPGECYPASEALEECQSDVVFELFELHRNRRGGQMQLLRGARIAQVACSNDEYL